MDNVIMKYKGIKMEHDNDYHDEFMPWEVKDGNGTVLYSHHEVNRVKGFIDGFTNRKGTVLR